MVEATNYGYDPTRYEKRGVRGTEDTRPWNLDDIIKEYLSPEAILVDVGCGTATKLIPLVPCVKTAYGLDKNLAMLKKACVNAQVAGVPITFIHGDSDRLPFTDNSIDVLTYMLSPRDSEQAFRVLKPEEGVIIAEHVGKYDKENIELAFGTDNTGKLRGHHIGKDDRTIDHMKSEAERAGFRIVKIQEGYWNTWYTRPQLEELCKSTPVARDFDSENDRRILNWIEQEYSTPRGIETQQHRILVVAKKS